MGRLGAVSSTISIFALLLISAFLAGIISCILFGVFLQIAALSGLSPIITIFGIIFSLPLLMCAHIWFKTFKDSDRIITWLVPPTFAAMLYGLTLGAVFFRNSDSNYLMFVTAIYTATGFLTSVFMWSLNKKILKIQKNKNKNLLGEIKNVSN